MIFYFTSTGNCLEVAKQLTDNLISIPQVLKSDIKTFEDEIIGIVVPNYQSDIPRPVKEFLDTTELKAKYFCGIVTYGANNGSGNLSLLNYAKQNHIDFNYINSIIMVDNSFVYFDMEKQVKNLPQKNVSGSIEKIKDDITNKVDKIYGTGFVPKFMKKLVKLLGDQKIEYYKNFYIEDTCIMCGICEKVCPIDNITLEDTPVIHDKCIRCGACYHNCPQSSIHYKNEKTQMRYRNNNVTLNEIIKANSGIYDPNTTK